MATEAGPEAWEGAADGSADPGWMLPLAVFCHVYSTYLSTASLAEMYEHQRPLALEELPRLLHLLKFALWQVHFATLLLPLAGKVG